MRNTLNLFQEKYQMGSRYNGKGKGKGKNGKGNGDGNINEKGSSLENCLVKISSKKLPKTQLDLMLSEDGPERWDVISEIEENEIG